MEYPRHEVVNVYQTKQVEEELKQEEVDEALAGWVQDERESSPVMDKMKAEECQK